MNKKIILFLVLSTILLGVLLSVDAQDENETDGNITDEPEIVKTPLTDCFLPCANKDGCICPSQCKMTGEIAHKSNCGGKKVVAVKEVSLCDGCMMDDICLEVGAQKQTMGGGPTFYCGSDKELERVKVEGELCSQDYECFSYICENQECVKESTGGINFKLFVFIGIGVVALGLGFLLLKFFLGYKKIAKEEKKMDREDSRQGRFKFQRPRYEYKPEYDELEQELKESLKRFK